MDGEARRPCVGTRAGRLSGHLRVRIHVDSSGCCHRPGRACDHDGDRLVAQPVDVRPDGDVHGHRHQRRQPGHGGNRDVQRGRDALASDVALNASGQATFTTSTLTVGNHPITAAYSGTTAFQASTSTTLNHTVRAATTTALASSLNPSTFGQTVTFTATVTGGGNPVTAGTVTFSDGATDAGVDVALDGSGQATFTTTTPARRRRPHDHRHLQRHHELHDEFWHGHPGRRRRRRRRWPLHHQRGERLFLDGTGSLAGAGATFSWDVNGDGTFGDATGATPTLTWAQLAALGITDGTGVPSTITLRLTDGLDVHGGHAADRRQRRADGDARQ